MRVYDNGIVRDATAEEIAELEARQEPQAPTEPTTEERIAALETALLEMLGVNVDD